MSVIEMSLLWLAGLFMGIIGVTSGGGATVGVPLILLFGYPANMSIVAVKFGLLGSFVTGTLAYRGAKKPIVKLPTYIWPLSIVGSILGANLVLAIDPHILRFIIIVLLVFVLILTFTVKPSKTQEHTSVSSLKKTLGCAVIFFLCVYSGFFGAGFGSFLIFALIYFYGYSFLESASIATTLALLVVGASTITFLLKGAVNFDLGIPLMVSCAIGGFVGVKIAHRAGDKYIRLSFIALTTVLMLKLGFEII
jgi:uncharacterized protein